MFKCLCMQQMCNSVIDKVCTKYHSLVKYALCVYVFTSNTQHCSTVDLPFTWKLFRPLTELDSSNGENPVVDELVCSTNSPFSVLPTSGTFPAASSHTFICQFLPSKVVQPSHTSMSCLLCILVICKIEVESYCTCEFYWFGVMSSDLVVGLRNETKLYIHTIATRARTRDASI